MTKLMITGDRMMSLAYAPLVAIEMMRALHKGDTIITGDNTGVELLVRDFAAAIEMPVEVVPTSYDVVQGKPAWDARHKALIAGEVSVVAIHAEPHSSSVIKSLSALMPDDELRIVTTLDLQV